MQTQNFLLRTYTMTNKILQHFITKTRNIDDRQIMNWPDNPKYIYSSF